MTGSARPAGRRSVRGRSSQARTDTGITVVEFVVAMALLAVILAAVGTVFLSSVRITRTLTVKTATTADARIALEAMTRTLRVALRPKGEAVALTVAKTDTITFYTSINRSGTTTAQPPAQVQYAWNGTCLNEVVTPGRTLTNPGTAGPFYAWDTGTTTKCLIRTTAAPTFTYYVSGQIASGGTDVAPITVPGTGLDQATRVTVQSIGISMTVTDPSNPDVTGTPVLDRVTLTNVLTDTGGN
jgi:Tfp pilus assembly protein PilW